MTDVSHIDTQGSRVTSHIHCKNCVECYMRIFSLLMIYLIASYALMGRYFNGFKRVFIVTLSYPSTINHNSLQSQ